MNNLAIALLSYLILPCFLLLGRLGKGHILVDPYSSTTIKGLLAIYLVVHHFVQKMWNQSYLGPMAWFGFVIVGWFFLTSGYGSFVSFEKNGFTDFWKKKIKRIWIPFVIAVPLEGFLRLYVLHQQGSVTEVLLKAVTLRTLDGKFMWYIATQIVMYVCFYAPYRLIINRRFRFAVMLFLIILFDAGNILLHQPDYKWVTCSCFAVGVLLGESKDFIRCHFEKFNRAFSVSAAAMAFLLISLILTWRHRRWDVFILIPLAEGAMVILTSRLKFHSKILHWLGTISFEIYITQLTMVEIAIWLWNTSLKALLLAILGSVLFATLVFKVSRALVATVEKLSGCLLRKSRSSS